MTRINCIPVEDLHDKHLVAEYRELPRVFSLAHAATEKGFLQSVHAYTLGTGHVKFFYDKLMYLVHRHNDLCEEMEKRGFATNLKYFYYPYFNNLEPGNNKYFKLWKNWEPTAEAIAINKQRIEERLLDMKK